ncbi:hypothetical protein PHYPSEUDO_011382 [Phytophthora pseudosyringae]|uniref:Uncharacterized protein n=1 Tax=Phytophthora pseudosyringae TaxID=221518 RepID=A0A8T1V9H1_9STRA|nr:hypothetical protein PHYPSEUDO_011382 [Phytophthora pseudosyringae]
MPPLTATPKALEPVVLAPTASVDAVRDAWLEKVFGPRRHCHEDNQRPLESKSRQAAFVNNTTADDAHSYRDELNKCIAQATANLSNGDADPLADADEESSDDDELTSSYPATSSGYSDVFDLGSEGEDDYVEPPVEVPRRYRSQDLQGGVLVGGDCVLFTNWAFKRLQQRRRRLSPIPERRDAGEYELPPADEEKAAKGVYSGQIVEL